MHRGFNCFSCLMQLSLHGCYKLFCVRKCCCKARGWATYCHRPIHCCDIRSCTAQKRRQITVAGMSGGKKGVMTTPSLPTLMPLLMGQGSRCREGFNLSDSVVQNKSAPNRFKSLLAWLFDLYIYSNRCSRFLVPQVQGSMLYHCLHVSLEAIQLSTSNPTSSLSSRETQVLSPCRCTARLDLHRTPGDALLPGTKALLQLDSAHVQLNPSSAATVNQSLLQLCTAPATGDEAAGDDATAPSKGQHKVAHTTKLFVCTSSPLSSYRYNGDCMHHCRLASLH